MMMMMTTMMIKKNHKKKMMRIQVDTVYLQKLFGRNPSQVLQEKHQTFNFFCVLGVGSSR
jgi:hypothetical protein